MAYQLVGEVLRFAPPGLPQGERSILIAIAEEARVGSRTAVFDRAELAQRTGLTAAGLRAALRRLRDRGVDVRVPLPGRTARDGRPVYAVAGTCTTYQLPPMAQAAQTLAAHLAAEKTKRDRTRAARPASHTTAAVVDVPAAAAVFHPTTDPAAPVDNPAEGGTGYPPDGIAEGGTELRRGGHSVALRGALSDPPSHKPETYPRAHTREAPAASCGQPEPTAARMPAVPALPASPALLELEQLGDAPPRCLDHSDVPAEQRPPSCRDCATLRRSWTGRRSELIRSEARARRRCTCCDELGWALTPALEGRAVRCPHPGQWTPSNRPVRRSPARTAPVTTK